MKEIFLESHHLKNLNFGFGQFNYHLIKSIYNIHPDDFKTTIHCSEPDKYKKAFGTYFNYKKYHSYTRYQPLRIKKKYDLWHSLNQNTKIEPFYSIPYLLTIHNISYIQNEENYKEKKNNVLFQNKINRSTAITYISNYAKKSTHKYFNVPNVPQYVIYNGNPILDTKIPKSYKPKIKIKKPYLFSIGEFTARKNFHTLLPMLTYLNDFNLIIAGKKSTTYADKLKILIQNYKLEDRVFFPGKVSEMDKKFLYKNAEAFVFPSLREGFGLPVIEAMAFGKPVFLSNNTSLPEIGGNFAFYWDNFEPKEMANKVIDGLNQYQNNEEEYKEQYYKQAAKFNWDNTAKKYIEVYRKILS